MSAPVRTQSVRTGKPSGGNWTAKARSGTDSCPVAEASASWGPVTCSYLPSNIFRHFGAIYSPIKSCWQGKPNNLIVFPLGSRCIRKLMKFPLNGGLKIIEFPMFFWRWYLKKAKVKKRGLEPHLCWDLEGWKFPSTNDDQETGSTIDFRSGQNGASESRISTSHKHKGSSMPGSQVSKRYRTGCSSWSTLKVLQT